MAFFQTHIVVIFLAASPGLFSQTSFTLATKDAKTTFRLGEPVDVEFRFQSTTPGTHSVWTTQPLRLVRQSEYDRFIVEPSESVADPLADIFAQMSGGMNSFIPRPSPLTSVPVTIELPMNEWLSIRKPGHYRITAETTRVVTTAQPSQPMPLRSNTIDIDVVAPEPGWAAAQLQQAVSVLQIPDPPPPVIGQTVDLRVTQSRDADVARAARTLRFLETKEAAPALARFFEHGPASAQGELRAGLFASPYRKEVIDAMEEALVAPDAPITYYYLGTLIELATLERFGGLPLYPAKGIEETKRWVEEFDIPYRKKIKPVETEYFAKLADAIGRKQGQARAVSLETLLTRGQLPEPATVKALVANFQLLPDSSQQAFLTQQWYRIAAPELEPMLQSIAEGATALRDSALRRLQEMNPEAARKIVLERIQKADVSREAFGSVRVLLTLPDKTLPAADDALVAALERHRPYAETLIARYASDAALPRVRAFVEQIPGSMCNPVLPAYFFRVDPAWAAEALARARKLRGSGCALYLDSNEDLLMSPALERQAIEDLSNPDILVVRAATTLLEHAGSPAAEKPLLDAFARLQTARPNATENRVLEYAFLTALLTANGWLPSEETLNRVRAVCTTDECSRQVASTQKGMQPPISIDPNPSIPDSSVRMGVLSLHSGKQFEDKIAQFPKGTSFYLTGIGEGSWYFQQRATEVKRILAAAGMKLVDGPSH